MPVVIYIFALCAFAIGFTEFISIGLSFALSESFHVSTAQTGLVVTLYATGVVAGAPVLTALASRWSRKRLLLTAMVVFTAGNVLAILSTHLPLLLAARLLSGLAHGVFFAVASSVATRLVAPERSGVALSMVFGGVTIAMAMGVPAGTWLGSVLAWQWVFGLIALCGILGTIGMIRFMPAGAGDITSDTPARYQLASLLNRHLLAAASLPLLSYTGSFALYSFITPILIQVTHTSIRGASIVLVAYGIGAAAGNIAGGRMTDRIGIDRASLWMLTGIALVLTLIAIAQDNFRFMIPLVMLLGLTTYGSIPPLQSRILGMARRHRPDALDAASGLNIAAFNAGVVFGSMLGAVSLKLWGLTCLAGVGLIVALLAIITLSWQRRQPLLRLDATEVSKE